ncbi:MAG: phosphatidylglycerophosphatase A [Desulfovibrio sp.]|jgi:phosphatidylglycerophosphatase A|nr:phosphatidylglycerophosphatase A [Desulfovibrio sp.]
MLISESLILGVARLWIAGKSGVMPGTCASFAAILLAPFLFMPLGFCGRLLFLCAILICGVPVATRAEIILGRKDPPEVVIDELLGQWLTLLPFSALSLTGYGAAFILFRIFDISKPWPIRRLESLSGGLGVMLDDAAAGLYAAICLALIKWMGGF